jgi:hypothetical protein
MITRDETGLTTEQYDAILAGQGQLARRITLRRRNLDFSQHDTFSASVGNNFDVYYSATENALYRVQNVGGILKVHRLASENGGDLSWVTKTNIDTGVANIRPSFGGTGAVFYVKSGNIYRATTTDQGNTWNVAEIVNLTDAGIEGTVTHVAGAGAYSVYFVVHRDDYNSNIWSSDYPFGTSRVYNSGIYIPHQFTGFDAKEMPTGVVGKDRNLIVLSTEMPIQIATKSALTSTQVVGLKREGVLAFINTGRRWSEHFVIEQFDDATEYQTRRYPLLSPLTLEDGTFILACVSHGVDGNANYHNEALHYSFSTDGKSWSQHELLTVDEQEGGGILVANGDYTYLCAATKTYRSYTTELTGTPASAVQEDLTDRVLNWSSTQDSGRSATLTLSDADGWYSQSLLATGGLYSIKTEFGLYMGGSAVLFPFGKEFVDTWNQDVNLPRVELTIQTRDNVARLNSEVHSSQAVLTDNQTLGADRYADPTETEYGGMGHTAALSGSWKTINDWLVLQSNNKRGVAESTFNIDVWNGVIETAARITEQGTAQFAGLVFRAYDKANFYSVEYKYADDRLHLYEIRGGEKTELAYAANFNWQLNTTYYLRVTYRYSHVVVETSTDGKTWAVQIDTILPGKDYSSGHYLEGAADVDAMLEEGSCGVTGRGYAPEEQWSSDPYDYDDLDDDFDGEVILPPEVTGEAVGGGSGLKSAIVGLIIARDGTPLAYRGMIAYTNTLGPQRNWHLLQSGLPVCDVHGVDPMCYINLDPYNADRAVVFNFNGGVYENTNWKNGGGWTPIKTAAQMLSAIQAVFPAVSGISMRDASFGFAERNSYYMAFMEADPAKPVVDCTETSVMVVRIRNNSTIDVCPYRFRFELDGVAMKDPCIQPSMNDANKFYLAIRGSGDATMRKAYWYIQTWGSWTHVHGSEIWQNSYIQDDTSSNRPCFIMPLFFREDGSRNDPEAEIFFGVANKYLYKSVNGGASFEPWGLEDIYPNQGSYSSPNYNPMNDGMRRDMFEIGNGTSEEKAFFTRRESNFAANDGLWILPRHGTPSNLNDWIHSPYPAGNEIGWVGGWPYTDAQFYFGTGQVGITGSTNRYQRGDVGWVVGMTQDRGATWIDLSGNLRLLSAYYGGGDAQLSHRAHRVVRMTPHFTET